MNIDAKIQLIKSSDDLNSFEIKDYWHNSLAGDINSQETLKKYFMKTLFKIKPLYSNLNENEFLNLLELSVSKALDRGLKFKVDDFEKYMSIACQTYFKYNLLPPNNIESINIPIQLVKSFSKIEDVYNCLPVISDVDDQIQIQLLSKGFEYPIFSTRLLYYSYMKWKNNTLRQIDIDLCVALLPKPHRVEWEIFYEKDITEVKNTILKNLNI